MSADPYADIARVCSARRQLADQGSTRGNDRADAADLPRLVRIIHDGGYRGYVPIETLAIRGVPYDPYRIVPAFTRDVRAALNSL